MTWIYIIYIYIYTAIWVTEAGLNDNRTDLPEQARVTKRDKFYLREIRKISWWQIGVKIAGCTSPYPVSCRALAAVVSGVSMLNKTGATHMADISRLIH